MQKRRKKYRWAECPSCHMLIFTEANTLGKHRCNKRVLDKKDAELDAVIDTELSTWDEDVKKFWKDNRTKFDEYLAEHGKI